MATGNALYYGDNLDILQRYVKDESVDLIYLDPPFNSNQDCGIRAVAFFGVEEKAKFSCFGAITCPRREYDCWKAVRLAAEESVSA